MAHALLTKFGNPAKDQKVVSEPEGKTFYSYGTPIARKNHDGTVTLFPAWNYSQTTNYYRGQFLGEGVNDTRRKIESGVYVMA